MIASSVKGFRAGQIASTFGHGSSSYTIKDGENIVDGRVVSVDATTGEITAYDGTKPFGIAVLDHYGSNTLETCLPRRAVTILLYGVIAVEKKNGESFAIGDTFDIDTDGTFKAGGDGSLGHVIDIDTDTILIVWKGF